MGQLNIAINVQRCDHKPMASDEACEVGDILAEALANIGDGYEIAVDTDLARNKVVMERLQCCADVCEMCRNGIPVYRGADGKQHHAGGPWGLGQPLCPAGPIWDRGKE